MDVTMLYADWRLWSPQDSAVQKYFYQSLQFELIDIRHYRTVHYQAASQYYVLQTE